MGQRPRVIGTFGPPYPSSRSRTVTEEVVEVTNELALAEVVGAWVNQQFPGDAHVAERVAARALAAYRGGASVTEACDEARSFLASWQRHPAQRRADEDVSVRLAS